MKKSLILFFGVTFFSISILPIHAMGERVYIPPSYSIDKHKFVNINPSNTIKHTTIQSVPIAASPSSILGSIRIGDKSSQKSGFLNGLYAPNLITLAKFRYVKLKILNGKPSELPKNVFSSEDIDDLNAVMASKDSETDQIEILKSDKKLWEKIFKMDLAQEVRISYYELEQTRNSYTSVGMDMKSLFDSINIGSPTKNEAAKMTLSLAFKAQENQRKKGLGIGREFKYKDEFTLILKEKIF